MTIGSGGMPRRIVGNLDCEASFATLAGRGAEGKNRKGTAGPLPRRVLETIAGAATLLRAFARDGDRLWLPAPVADDAMADVPGLPRPVLESAPLDDLAPMNEVLAWGETETVARMRGSSHVSRSACHAPLEAADNAGWNLLWQLPAPTPDAAAMINDRRFSLNLASQLGCRLPGTGVVASPSELKVHRSTVGVDRWVLKAPFSAAGRWRVIHRGGAVTPQTMRQVARLFARHGELVFEPWMERVADVGYAAAVISGGLLRVSLHRLLVDDAGRFRGLELMAGDPCAGPWLHAEERSRLESVLEGAAHALQQAGYSGPFGIDAWRYRLPGDGDGFHPLGEINGRLTFGWVARALLDRVRGPLGIDPGSRVRLIFGRRADERAGVKIVPLFNALGATSASPADPEIRLEIFEPS